MQTLEHHGEDYTMSWLSEQAACRACMVAEMVCGLCHARSICEFLLQISSPMLQLQMLLAGRGGLWLRVAAVLWQGVTAVTPNLRILHFKTTDVLVIRQTTPLPPVDQPAGGHRLIYHMLTGAIPNRVRARQVSPA